MQGDVQEMLASRLSDDVVLLAELMPTPAYAKRRVAIEKHPEKQPVALLRLQIRRQRRRSKAKIQRTLQHTDLPATNSQADILEQIKNKRKSQLRPILRSTLRLARHRGGERERTSENYGLAQFAARANGLASI
jgi:hypothetical protein